MNGNWQYFGIFFDSVIQDRILNFAKRYVKIPNDWKIYCHHMTIVYNDGSDIKQKLAEKLEPLVGTVETLNVVGIGISDRAVALKIDYRTANKISHVTVAVAPGAKPVESNDIIDWKQTENFELKGILSYVEKKSSKKF
jgi:hypothetical protein